MGTYITGRPTGVRRFHKDFTPIVQAAHVQLEPAESAASLNVERRRELDCQWARDVNLTDHVHLKA